MHNPNSFGGAGAYESNEAGEADRLRSEYQARGHETYQDYQNLLAEEARLEAMLNGGSSESNTQTEPNDFSLRQETPGESSTEASKNYESTIVSPAEVAKKAKANLAFKKKITRFAIGALAMIGVGGVGTTVANALSGGGPINSNKAASADAMTKVNTIESSIENSQYAGELPNGLRYDYTEYADRENKVAYNAYGHNYSSQFNNREEATKGIMSMATNEPEALASYAYNVFTAEEKQELGIGGLNMAEIDDKFSSANDGGAMQKKILDKLNQVLNDKDTSFNFYYENDTENTNYVYFVDSNKDGNMTPDELHLGYDTKKRTNAPQVDILRTIHTKDASGKEIHQTIKLLDLNMACGYQPNYEQAPIGIPYISADGQEQVVTIKMGGGPIEVKKDQEEDKEKKKKKEKEKEKDEDKDDDKKDDEKDDEKDDDTKDDEKDDEEKPVQPEDPVQPEEEHEHKNEEKERENAGDHVTPLEVDNEVTPPTTIEQDQDNFAAIEQQKKDDQAAAERAAEVAREQAAKEEQAKEQAKTREVANESNSEQVAKADEAKAAAESQAAAEQAAAAESERAAAAEEAAREEAQREANEQAESHSEEAESHSDDTASERAAAFENGDF